MLSSGGAAEYAPRATPGIVEVTISAKADEQLVPLPEESSYLGFLFARGSFLQTVEDSLRQAHKELRLDISPSLPVAR